jgi:hypothetical protein
MTTAIFETESAIFQFNLPAVKEILAFHSSEDQTKEVANILKILESLPKGTQKITIKNGYFGYLVLDLLGRGNGSAFCKSCQKAYQAKQLQSFPLGFGESPLSVKVKKKGGISRGCSGKGQKEWG